MSNDNINTGVTGEDTGIHKDEWLRRYKDRLIEVAGITEDAAQSAAVDAVSFDELVDGFEDNPEAAADEEMSYWSD